MKNKDHWQASIERYLNNQLKGEELVAFETALKNDPALAKELDLQTDLMEGIRTSGNRELKEQLKQIHQETIDQKTPPKKKTRTISLWKIISAAAAAILIGFLVFQTISSSDLNNQQLYATYFQPIELNHQSRNEEATHQLLEASSLYEAKKYTEALPLFQTLLALDPTDTKLQLATGICLLELNQTSQALPHFQKILALNDPFLNDHANWYSALSHLKVNQVEKTKIILQQLISDTDADHFEAAKQLLDQLK